MSFGSKKNIEPSLLLIIFLLCISPILKGCNKPTEVSESRFLMHTYIEIKIVDNNTLLAQKALDEAFMVFTDYESNYNFYNPESTLCKLNRGDISKIQLSHELSDILKACLNISEKSGGAFDITVGPLVRLWDFGAAEPRVPDREKIKKLLPLVNYNRVSLRDGELEMKPGTSIDLSGAIKGFAVDKACECLTKLGISKAMVNAGGNIRVIGRNAEGKPWKIGIVDPRAQDEIVAYLFLENEATATSGDYQRYFIKDSKRYHHILDPRTGYPVNSKCTGVTTVSKNAAMTDMLSTAAFVLGPEKGRQFLENMGSLGVFITDSTIYVSPGLEKKIEIVNKKYKR